MAEQWREVEGWRGYEVSDLGRVRSWKRSRQTPDADLPRVLSSWQLSSGYLLVTLKDCGRRANMYVHRLVLAAFVGPCPEGREAAHWDGDKENNALGNLRYATPAENTADKRRHGSIPAGAAHYATALTREDAQGIKNHPGTHRDAATAFGVTYHTAYRIRTGRTWRHL